MAMNELQQQLLKFLSDNAALEERLQGQADELASERHKLDQKDAEMAAAEESSRAMLQELATIQDKFHADLDAVQEEKDS